MQILGRFLPCLYAFAACAGFSILFNIHGCGILICSLGGALGWLVYLLAESPAGGSTILQSLFAAMVLAAYSELMARVRKCPVTPYVLIASLPLVPGAGIYYTMEYAINGDIDQFLNSFLHTLGLAGALALGILLVGSAVRLINRFHQKRMEAERSR